MGRKTAIPKTRRSDARRLILDAAEVLFAERGYDGVGIREIMTVAGVNLGLATYHFQTKEFLFESAIARRAEALGRLRLEALQERRRAGPLSIEGVLAAFVDPYRACYLSKEPGWRSYALLIAQTVQSPRWGGILSRHFNSVLNVFIDAALEVSPGADRQACVNAFVFSIAVMINTFASSHRIEGLLGRGRSGDREARTYRDMMTYLAAGFRETARPRKV